MIEADKEILSKVIDQMMESLGSLMNIDYCTNADKLGEYIILLMNDALTNAAITTDVYTEKIHELWMCGVHMDKDLIDDCAKYILNH